VRLLNRYVLRELAAPFVFALAALTSIMLLNQIAKRFGALVGKGLPWSVIGEVFLLSLPFIVAMTLPMAVLLAVLYAFSHLAAGNEITAMRAGGVSVGQLLRPVFAAALLLSALTFLFMDQLLPASNLRLKALVIDIGRKKPTFDLQEQAINEIPPSLYYLRAGRIDASSGRLRDVTIYDMSGQQSRRVIYADSGRMAFEEGQIDLNLRLWDGSIQSFKGADPALFQLTYFRVNTLRVRNVANALERGGTEVSRSDREMSTCQMLAIVRDSSAAVRAARARSRGLLERDLQNLLGLSPAASLETPAAPPRPHPAYCGWWSGWGGFSFRRRPRPRSPHSGLGAARQSSCVHLSRGSHRSPPAAVPIPSTCRFAQTRQGMRRTRIAWWRSARGPTSQTPPSRCGAPPGAATSSRSKSTRSGRSAWPGWCSCWSASRWPCAFPGVGWAWCWAAGWGSSRSTT
jgi:hypothetical protein